jgi:hypothetical protein
MGGFSFATMYNKTMTTERFAAQNPNASETTPTHSEFYAENAGPQSPESLSAEIETTESKLESVLSHFSLVIKAAHEKESGVETEGSHRASLLEGVRMRNALAKTQEGVEVLSSLTKKVGPLDVGVRFNSGTLPGNVGIAARGIFALGNFALEMSSRLKAREAALKNNTE